MLTRHNTCHVPACADVEDFWSGGVYVKGKLVEYNVIKRARYSSATTLLTISGLNIKSPSYSKGECIVYSPTGQGSIT